VSYTRFGFQIKADAWRKFLGGCRFVADECPITFEQKKIDLDAYINGTPPSRLQRRKFYVVMRDPKVLRRVSRILIKDGLHFANLFYIFE
jgi:hypothetical protein